MTANALVLGCGRIGAMYDLEKEEVLLSHAKGYHRSPRTRLLGVIDPDPEKREPVARKYGCPGYASLEEAPLEEADLISICTPTALHCRNLLELHARKFQGLMILEKPAVQTREEVDTVLALDEGFLDRVYINYIRRYDQLYLDTIARIRQGEFGPIRAVEVAYFGGFEHNGIHAFNLLCFLFGGRPSVRHHTERTSVFDFSGVPVLFLAPETGYTNYDIVLYAEGAKIVFDQLGYRVRIQPGEASPRFDGVRVPGPGEERQALNGYVLNMIDMVLRRSPDCVGIREGIDDIQFIREHSLC